MHDLLNTPSRELLTKGAPFKSPELCILCAWFILCFERNVGELFLDRFCLVLGMLLQYPIEIILRYCLTPHLQLEFTARVKAEGQ